MPKQYNMVTQSYFTPELEIFLNNIFSFLKDI